MADLKVLADRKISRFSNPTNYNSKEKLEEIK